MTILRSKLDFVEKRSFCCFGRTFSAKEAEAGEFTVTCFLILHVFNAYLQRKALEHTRDRFSQDKNISIMNFTIMICILMEPPGVGVGVGVDF